MTTRKFHYHRNDAFLDQTKLYEKDFSQSIFHMYNNVRNLI